MKKFQRNPRTTLEDADPGYGLRTNPGAMCFARLATWEKLPTTGWMILLMFAVAVHALLIRCVYFLLHYAVLELSASHLHWGHR